jgi:hypothetical protein
MTTTIQPSRCRRAGRPKPRRPLTVACPARYRTRADPMTDETDPLTASLNIPRDVVPRRRPDRETVLHLPAANSETVTLTEPQVVAALDGLPAERDDLRRAVRFTGGARLHRRRRSCWPASSPSL